MFIQADVDLMNMALRRIGAESIALSDANAPNTKACKIVTGYYPNTVKEVLRIMPWNSAIARSVIAGVADTTTAFQQKYSLASMLPYPYWVGSTAYTLGQMVANSAGNVYVCVTAGISAASGGPTTTVANGIIADGTVSWVFLFAGTANFIRTLEINGDPNLPYLLEGSNLFCNAASPIKLRYISLPTPPFSDPILVESIVSRLASKICYPITAMADVAQALYQEFTLNLAIGKQVMAVEDRGDVIDLFGLYQNAQLAIRQQAIQA